MTWEFSPGKSRSARFVLCVCALLRIFIKEQMCLCEKLWHLPMDLMAISSPGLQILKTCCFFAVLSASQKWSRSVLKNSMMYLKEPLLSTTVNDDWQYANAKQFKSQSVDCLLVCRPLLYFDKFTRNFHG